MVGENGAFTFYMSDGIRKRMDTPSGEPPADLHRQLKTLGSLIQKRFPEARWASDQAYREYDLAIDICEDVPPWPRKRVDALLNLCREQGAHAKLSSIHVNTWFGKYDKQSGFKNWLKSGAPGSKQIPMKNWIFIGDSPNDEPLFSSFTYSVGVANLKKYLPELDHPPVWITREKSGKGFAEMAQKLIKGRKNV